MNAEEVYLGQIVKYKEWEELSEHWESDSVGDLRIIDSDGRLLDFVFQDQAKSLRDVEFEVVRISSDKEGCYAKLAMIPQDEKFGTTRGTGIVTVPSTWVHSYKLDPVEPDTDFDETGFLSMLGVKGVKEG